MSLNSISIAIQSNLFFVLIAIIILFAYTYYVYKYTIPQVTNFIRLLLITFRSLSIALILFLIFEPIITITYKKSIEPKIYLFTDNSNSLAAKDSSKRLNDNLAFIRSLESFDKNQIRLYTFGLKPTPISFDSLNKIKYNEPITNFENVVSILKNSDENICAAIIISDGILTDGSNPIYDAEKLPFPIFTIGIGDTAAQRDIKIQDILFNQYIYAGKQTEIEALISHTGFNNYIARASLYEEDKLIETKDVELHESEFSKVKFNYTPKKSGEKKLRISISSLKVENNSTTNQIRLTRQKSFFVNILENKIKVAIISGSPSPDLSAISKALEDNKDIELKKIIHISSNPFDKSNKFWDNPKQTIIDSADVLFLIDFPSTNSPQNLVEQVFSNIEIKNKSYFLLLSANADLRRLSNYEKLLPFSIKNISENYVQVQPSIFSNSISSIFSESMRLYEWNNLPPLIKNNSEIIPKPGSDILVKGIIRNLSLTTPIIIARNIGNQRTFAILAGDIWRWQLQTAEKNPLFFQNFLNNIVKWLNVSNTQSQFSVRTSKKFYSIGEPVEFYAELYDQTFSPVDSAQISLTIYNNKNKYKLILEKVKTGLFHASFQLEANEFSTQNLSLAGNYYYEALAEFDGTFLKSKEGRFSVGEINIEKQNTQMDVNFLKQLSGIHAYGTSSNNGKFYFINNSSLLRNKLQEIINNSKKEKIITTEIDLRINQWILFVIIFLLAIEWFTRKRLGMI